MTIQLERPATISEVVDWIAQGKLLLPAIQREYEWQADQVVALFDSLMRDYPIGSFLFWKVSAESSSKYRFYKFLPYYHERDKRHNEPAAITTPYELTVVLDGQQRLTSLFIALASYRADKLPYKWWKSPDAYPETRLYLNLRKEHDNSDDIGRLYDFRFLTAAEAAENDNDYFWFSVSQALRFGSGTELLANTMTYVGATPPVSSSPFALATLSKLVTVINTAPVINYFQEREQRLDHVLNVFIRLNSGGTPLSYSDLLLSVATAQWKGDARQAIHGLVDELNKVGGNQFNFDADFVLKSALVLTDRPNVRFEVDNFDREATAQMELLWEDAIRKPLLRAVELAAAIGYDRRTLVTDRALIPVAYYLRARKAPESVVMHPDWADDRKRIRDWLSLAILKNTFSSKTDLLLTTLRKVIQKDPEQGFPLTEIETELARLAKPLRFTEEELESLLDAEYGARDTFSILTVIYPALSGQFTVHMDHIFPKAGFTKRALVAVGMDEKACSTAMDQFNRLSNLQLLEGSVNTAKLATPFEKWSQPMQLSPDQTVWNAYRSQNYIPSLDGGYGLAQFPTFVARRRDLLKAELRARLPMFVVTATANVHERHDTLSASSGSPERP